MTAQKSLFDLTGETVLVTGSTRGIGAALAHGLATAGARVVVHGRNAEDAAAQAAHITAETGSPTDHASFDVADRDAIESSVADLVARIGPITGLVNNAGMQLRKPLLDLELEEWDLVLRTNVTSAFLVGTAVARGMLAEGRGSIVNICSIQSDLARPSIAPYTASKGALRNLTRAMTAEWAASGVRVNGIAPGYLDTDMTKALVDDPEFSAWVIGRTPAKRWGRPEDLVGAAVFLLAPASAFISGQVIFVDGGMSVVV
ncbi:SDR family oxidoreductase [Pseudolysinimonas sp.]|uniref:SDR family oxidoreductase n=1 Tax=Pseudolysinimonas sp. TaxID=2680009 RepID=UPI00286AAED6|nr:SDR family oxidoreductase [Pseudolysinimonas sp.]